MDDETRNHLEAMEDRLMGRLDNAQETIIERVRACENSISALAEVARAGNTTMNLIASLIGDVARRTNPSTPPHGQTWHHR